MPELACGLLVLLHGGRSHMVGEAKSWGSDYFGGKVVPGAAAQPVEVQGEGLCWVGHLGGDYVTGAALRPVEVKGTNIRISVSAEGCRHSPE